MSAWCPLTAVHATSRPSKNTGLNTATSLFWLPRLNTSLWKKTSPGEMSSPNFDRMCLQTGASENARIGRFSVCSSIRPSAS